MRKKKESLAKLVWLQYYRRQLPYALRIAKHKIHIFIHYFLFFIFYFLFTNHLFAAPFPQTEN